MNLYYGLTNFHLLCCILHRFIYNDAEQAVFVSSQGILKSRIDKLKKSNIFDDVFFLEDTNIREESFSKLKDSSNVSEIEEVAIKFVDNYEKFLPFTIDKFSNIYLTADHGVFGLYVLLKKRKYVYLEDGRGIYSNWQVLDNLLKIKNPKLQIMCNHVKSYGRSHLITKKYVAFDSQNEEFDCTDCIDFDVNNLFDKLSSEQLEKIFEIFDMKPVDIDYNCKNALILTQRFTSYNMLESEECGLLYALLCDIFAKDCKINLKPHPADKTNYSEIFDCKDIIDKEMPSELIRFIIKKKFDIGICTYSSSINSLKPYINEIYYIDESIANYKQNIFKLYALFELAKKLNFKIVSNEDKLYVLFKKLYGLDSEVIIGYLNCNSDINIFVSDKYFDNANLILNIDVELNDTKIKQKLYLNAEKVNLKAKILKYNDNKILPLSKVLINVDVEEI